jgi:site-specific recombinase XerD
MDQKTRSALPIWLAELLDRMEEEMILRGMARGTRSGYLGHVRRFYLARGGGRPEVSSPEIRRWLVHLLTEGKSHSYTGQTLGALRFLFRHVLGLPAPVANIPRSKRKKQLPKVIGLGDVRRFLDALPVPKQRAIAFALYSAGLRVGECVRLKVSDIDAERAGLPKKVTPHTLRHSLATHLLEAGTNLTYIRDLLGHRKIETTATYTHVARTELRKIRSPVDRLFEEGE